MDIHSNQEPSPEGEGTDWGMLSIIGSLFAARQHGVEDEAAPPTEAWFRLEMILDAALQCSSPAQGEGQHRPAGYPACSCTGP